MIVTLSKFFFSLLVLDQFPQSFFCIFAFSHFGRLLTILTSPPTTFAPPPLPPKHTNEIIFRFTLTINSYCCCFLRSHLIVLLRVHWNIRTKHSSLPTALLETFVSSSLDPSAIFLPSSVVFVFLRGFLSVSAFCVCFLQWTDNNGEEGYPTKQ